MSRDRSTPPAGSSSGSSARPLADARRHPQIPPTRQNSLKGKANHVLSQSMTQQMLTPGKGGWGLGLQLGGSAADPWFSHGGVNAGYESMFVGYDQNGDGAVVMTNAQGGSRLAAEVMSAIA